MKLDIILSDWEKECIIDSDDIINETIKCSRLHSKYLRLYSMNKIKIKTLLLEMDKLKKDLLLYYSGKLTKEEKNSRNFELDPFNGLSKPLKSEFDIWIKSNENYQNLESKIEYQKIFLETIEEIMNTLRWRHSHVKNIIDMKKFEIGM